MAVNPAGGQDVFDVERIRRLIDLMKEHDLGEIDLKQNEQQIRLVRGGIQSIAPASMRNPTQITPVQPATSGSGPVTSDDGPHVAVIKSPMVGTFYNRPNPKSEAFVKVGSAVATDTIVCIVEAMKVFNEIPAEVRGKIVAVLVENEEPVDFGRPLFKVDTRG